MAGAGIVPRAVTVAAVRGMGVADIPATAIAATAGDGEAPVTGIPATEKDGVVLVTDMAPARASPPPAVQAMAGRKATMVLAMAIRMRRAGLPITITPRTQAVAMAIA